MDVDVRKKRYVVGKYIINSNGNPEYQKLAEQAFISSVDMIPVLSREKFERIMREQNVPEEITKKYLANFKITNETSSQDYPDLEMMSGVQTQLKILNNTK